MYLPEQLSDEQVVFAQVSAEQDVEQIQFFIVFFTFEGPEFVAIRYFFCSVRRWSI